MLRGDYHIIGDTWWGPGDPRLRRRCRGIQTARDAVNVARRARRLAGATTGRPRSGAKNVLDEEYNDEFSHPFVWKAQPQRWGIEYTKSF